MRDPLAPALVALAAGQSAEALQLDERACQQALEHRIGGLVTTAILSGEASTPPGWDRRLRSADAMSQLWHGLQLATMARVSGILDALGIDHVYIKGAANAERWYERTGERVSVDVDVVLSPHQSDRWFEAIDTIAPAEARPYRASSPAELRRELAVKLRLEGGCDLDVHFDVLKYGIPSRSVVEAWRRRQPLTLSSGQEVQVLDPTTALAQQLLELNRDRFRYLQNFAEIGRILRNEAIDWGYLERLATAEGMREPVFLSLEAVRSELGLASTVPKDLARWPARIWRATWPRGHRLQGDVGAMKWRHRERLLAFFPSGRRREAVRSVWRYFFPSSQKLESLYPGTRGPYLWRNFWPRIAHARVRRAATAEVRRRDGPST